METKHNQMWRCRFSSTRLVPTKHALHSLDVGEEKIITSSSISLFSMFKVQNTQRPEHLKCFWLALFLSLVLFSFFDGAFFSVMMDTHRNEKNILTNTLTIIHYSCVNKTYFVVRSRLFYSDVVQLFFQTYFLYAI